MKTAKLFINGQSQALRLPKEFRFKGEKVYIKKCGNLTILMPLENPWGQLIGPLDMMVAGHAESLDLVLVTNDVREFSRVRNLRVENWAENNLTG